MGSMRLVSSVMKVPIIAGNVSISVAVLLTKSYSMQLKVLKRIDAIQWSRCDNHSHEWWLTMANVMLGRQLVISLHQIAINALFGISVHNLACWVVSRWHRSGVHVCKILLCLWVCVCVTRPQCSSDEMTCNLCVTDLQTCFGLPKHEQS